MTIEETLERHKSSARYFAKRYANNRDQDDVAQELLIAVWKHREKNEGFQRAVMRNRAKTLANDTTWTGHSGKQGKVRDPMDRAWISETPDTDSEQPQMFSQYVLDQLATEIVEGIETAYHQGEICEALDALKPDHKAYVVLRFWYGMTNREIADELGRRSDMWERTWREAIQPKLQKELAHLG